MMDRNVHRMSIELSPEERKVYDLFERYAITEIQGVQAKNTYMTALVLLLRLRQICDHVALATKAFSDDEKSAMGIEVSSKSNPNSTTAVANSKSITSWNNSDSIDGKADDSLARILESMSISQNSYQYTVQDTVDERTRAPVLDCPSAKTKALVHNILLQDPTRKTIVFSQFTSFFPLIEKELDKCGIGYVRYEGTMSSKAREQALDQLRTKPKVIVLLCSLKAGALGLNLTCASRVVIMDPWWNPMVSEQAIDRVHRIGQARDVDVYEMVVQNSVEERIMMLQEKKRAIAKAVIDGERNSKINTKLTMKELLALFY